MKLNKFIVPILLIFIILISLSAVYADEISNDKYLNIQNEDISLDSTSNLGFSENEIGEINQNDVDSEKNALKNVNSENILKSDEEGFN